jgi:TnpA family transposase
LPLPQDTAYPRLKTSLSPRDLHDFYTPSPEEIALAEHPARSEAARLGFLVRLKTFQRLGYFLSLDQVPAAILEHIARAARIPAALPDLTGYDDSGSRRRHMQLIRERLGVQPYDRAARHAMIRAMNDAAKAQQELADLVNVAIEELIRLKYELPVFDTLARAARHVRAVVYRQYYHQVHTALDEKARARIDALFASAPESRFTPWNTLRQEPGRPTLTHLKNWLERQNGLKAWRVENDALRGIPEAKVQHFAAEARTLDAARMLSLEPYKRVTLAVSLLKAQSARGLDDLGEMLIKRVASIHQKGREALAEYRAKTQERTDELVRTLRDLVVAYRTSGTERERLAAIRAVLGEGDEAVLNRCEEHIAHASDSYFPFLWRFYRSHRATLFRLLRAISVRSTSQDRTLESAIRFLLGHERSLGEELRLPTDLQGEPLLDLSWIPDPWWRLVTGQRNRTPRPRRVHRRHLEICLFTQLAVELKSGDLFIPDSDRFADYRDQLISWEEYRERVSAYGEMVGLPVEGAAFVTHFRDRLRETALATDRSIPNDPSVRIEGGEPILRRPEKTSAPASLPVLEAWVADRLGPTHLLEILRDTEHWLNWTRFFGPISGHDAKLEDAASRYVATTFCYGCHLGPTQTARSLGTVDRRQLAWINLRHVTEERLDRAIREVINGYHRFALPKRWGTGKSASADGTKWDLYEQNLLAEYHIRYGGYGGIGYYHVSDTYIALFSHFIPCGVWEAVYILDGLLKNESDIQPDTIHADTQGQSAPVFGLAALLQITLMPRIRNWKELTLYRPDKETSFEQIDGLLTGEIDWDLIRTHLPDMLRVVLSIQAGRIAASTLLHRLGTYSRKNRLYQAFRELGRAVRTEFLLKYLSDSALRSVIQAATNKSEAFNGFAQWVAFGGDGTIPENDRAEQRKIIKYNHLVANCVIFHNVFQLSRLLHDLQQHGEIMEDAAITALSPYLTAHINRFGRYHLDMEQRPPELIYDLLA